MIGQFLEKTPERAMGRAMLSLLLDRPSLAGNVSAAAWRNPMSVATTKFSAILWSFAQLMKLQARRHEKFRGRLHERNLVAQIKARDEEVGRWFELRNGKVKSGAGFHKAPDITLAFKDASLGASLLTPPINWLDQINAQKDFKLSVDGPEDLTNWWAQTMMATLTAGRPLPPKPPAPPPRFFTPPPHA